MALGDVLTAPQPVTETHWDVTVDVLVVGSGGGAMTAAITAYDRGADVLVVEKADHYGGTTAISGGGVWIPNNHDIRGNEVGDTPEDAYAYMKDLIGNDVADDKIQAYVDNAPEMIDYLEARTSALFKAVPYSDYFPEKPGGKPGYRTMQVQPVSMRQLGDDADQLLTSSRQALLFNRVSMTIDDVLAIRYRSRGWLRRIVFNNLRYWTDIRARLKGPRDSRLSFGSALIAHLRLALKKRDIPLWLSAPFKQIITSDNHIEGAIITRDGRDIAIKTRKGVIMGAGGFERNDAMRAQYLPKPTQSKWSASHLSNTGDTIQAGMEVGAQTDLMDAAWWGPSIPVDQEDHARVLFFERSSPGCIIVNQDGKRFANEALPYLDFVQAMYEAEAGGGSCIPAYVIFDAAFRKKYSMGPLLPTMAMPDAAIPAPVREILFCAETIEDLAAKLNVPEQNLKDTVANMNRYATTGKDEEFGKGDGGYDRAFGDIHIEGNPCLAPVEKPPFYAMAIYPGDIGTKGGLLTDKHGQVMSEDGGPIKGLYAVGNNAASVMGRKYPGAGSTIGPSMTFGYIAARHIAGNLD